MLLETRRGLGRAETGGAVARQALQHVVRLRREASGSAPTGAAASDLPVGASLFSVLVSGAELLPAPVGFFRVVGGLVAFGLLGIFIGPVALALAVALLEVTPGQAGSPRLDAAG